MNITLSLPDAQQQILEQVISSAPVEVPLAESLGRIAACSLKSIISIPGYHQSSRDGYAVSESPLPPGEKMAGQSFNIIGEVAAGDTEKIFLNPGEAVRIMTGGLVPRGAVRVAPFEECQELEGKVLIPVELLNSPQKFIRYRGSDVPVGKVLVSKGRRLEADHLLGLVETGYAKVPVFSAPAAAVVCTGNELFAPGENILEGQKNSGNSVLLAALLASSGVENVFQTLAPDDGDVIYSTLLECLKKKPDIIITTGGMGPGKYDLLASVFKKLDGRIIYNALNVRPGKSTLFGIWGETLFFALPGPPPAVRLLFHELILPAIFKLQGMAGHYPRSCCAALLDSIEIKSGDSLSLRGAVMSVVKGRLWVKPAKKAEAVNAVMLLPGGSRFFAAGSSVNIHLVGPFQELFCF